MADLVYYELGWAILSTICLANVLFGFSVVGIIGLSPVSSIPIVVSSAGAVANGLSYYVFYADYPVTNTAVASVFGDMLWMVQEAGNVFYSYAILSRIMYGRDLRMFRILFWTLMVAILVLRTLIAVYRARGILNPELASRNLINNFHTAYFTSIAIVECVSAYFLLRKLASARRSLRQASLHSSIFSHLMRSTEMRVATLALIGGARAVTYYFQPSGQRASSVANQIDRFIYTLECMFPVMMFIDMLASKLVSSNQIQDRRMPSIRATWRSTRTRRDDSAWDDDATSQAELDDRTPISIVSNNDLPGQPGKAVLSNPPSVNGDDGLVVDERGRVGYAT